MTIRCCLLLLCIVAVPVRAEPEWVTRHDAGGLLVESRPHAGSSIEAFRGRLTLAATLGEIIALLQDADYNKRWVYRSGGARVLAAEGIERTWVHGVVDAPAPMKDRDTVVRFDLEQDPESRVILIKIVNQPTYLPEQPEVVRVPEFGGFWRLEPESDEAVRVVYQVYGDPGGFVPGWLANLAALRSVVATLQAMPRAVRRYAGTRVEGIQDY
ncbi:MAG: hypothetical protein AAGI11_08810 [Pseudomonadota bacterium]